MTMQLPPDASSCLYIEGLPSDATEREVSHIFRRFEGQGYQSIRMIPRESSKSGSKLFLCFVEFDNAHQATVAMNQLQGYRVDKTVDSPGIRISFSNKTRRAPAAERPGRAAARSADSSRRGQQDEMQDAGSRRQSYDGDNRGNNGHRRDGREHRDSFNDEYEDSERGDDDYATHAAEHAMQGIEGMVSDP